MAASVFYLALNMSLCGSVVILCLLLVRKIRPVRRRAVYALWSLAFFRLVFPFALSGRFSLFNYTGELIRRVLTVDRWWVTAETPGPFPMTVSNYIGAAQRHFPFPMTYRSDAMERVFTIGAAVWLVGALTGLTVTALLYAFTMRELRRFRPDGDGLCRSPAVDSPMLAGILRPRVVVPVDFDASSAEAAWILRHEAVHRKRRDNLWRLAAIAVTCLHWFNPLAWVMLRAFLTDMELACDEAVMRRRPAEDRKAYARALLAYAGGGRRLLLPAAFGGTAVRTRIRAVLDYRQLTLLGLAATILFLGALAAALLTNPL